MLFSFADDVRLIFTNLIDSNHAITKKMYSELVPMRQLL